MVAKHFRLAVALALMLSWCVVSGCAVRRIASVYTVFSGGDSRAAEILDRYEEARASQQASLLGYEAVMLVEVLRPGVQQSARASVRKVLRRPGDLTFQNVQLEGDRFIKVNVISRILQEEQNGASEENGRNLAITRQNYSFKYLGERRSGDQMCHLFRVKPRTNTAGLFRGHIWIDAESFQPIRVEGELANKPSWFVKHVSFVKDYEKVGEYVLPSVLTAVSQIRFVGSFISRITYRYQDVRLMNQQVVRLPAAEAPGSALSLCIKR